MNPNTGMPDPERYWKAYIRYLRTLLPWEQRTRLVQPSEDRRGTE